MARDIFQVITDQIAAQLEQGVKPWMQPWKNSEGGFLPHNCTGGNVYRGANVWLLLMVQQTKGYPTSQWLTFNQAKAHGGTVRKGEAGTPVFFWLFGEKVNKETGEKEKTFTVRQYAVFNLAQTEGVTLPASQQTVVAAPTEPERVAAAEAMIAATGARINHGGDRAYFSPSADYVQMPPLASFADSDGYYSTMFHELGHWTGHDTRLKREFGKRFGDDAYAFEELVAELTSAFVCGANGFANVEREDHAAYIGSWIKRLKTDPKAFIKAASEAQKAADMVMGLTKKEAEGEADQSQAA